MGNIKFGTGQVGKPTPQKASLLIDLFSGVSGVVIAWITTAAFIPSHVSNIIASILGLLLSISQVLKRYFGTDVEREDVEPKDITEVKTE